MEERVTLKDIAKMLNVSIGTVERAIHGKNDINPNTKKLILEKIEALNYKPNKFARSLSVKNMKKVAVIMPCNSDFWYKVKSGIEFAEREFSCYGTHIEYICLNRMDGNIVLSYLKKFHNENYEGIVLVPVNLDDIKEQINEYINNGLCISLLNDDSAGLKRHFYIGPDNGLIGNLAGELIGKLSHGKGKCLVIAGTNIKSGDLPVECKQRVSGFKKTIETEYPGVSIELCTYKMYFEDAYSTTSSGLENNSGITSIYSVDGYLNEVAMAVKDSGRKSIAIVGHEMSDEVNRHLADGTVSATICQNPFLQGYFSLKYMVEYLIDKKIPLHHKMYINFNIYTKYNTFGKENYANDIRINL